MEIKKWTETHKPSGLKQRHANVNGIEFVANPFQAFVSEKRNGFTAIVRSDRLPKDGFHYGYSAKIGKGKEGILQTEYFETMDEAFEAAAKMLRKRAGHE